MHHAIPLTEGCLKLLGNSVHSSVLEMLQSVCDLSSAVSQSVVCGLVGLKASADTITLSSLVSRLPSGSLIELTQAICSLKSERNTKR